MQKFKEIEMSDREHEVARDVVDCAISVHRHFGPGMLEHVYEICLQHELRKRGYKVQRQLSCPVAYDGFLFDEGFRLDLIVEDLVICELKAVDEISSLHRAQLRTYLKFTGKRVGFVLNFRVPLMKDGIRRILSNVVDSREARDEDYGIHSEEA